MVLKYRLSEEIELHILLLRMIFLYPHGIFNIFELLNVFKKQKRIRYQRYLDEDVSISFS